MMADILTVCYTSDLCNLIILNVVGVAGMKVQLNTRDLADRAYADAEATTTRPMSANSKV